MRLRNGEDRQSNSIQNYLSSSSSNAEDALGKWLSEHKNPWFFPINYFDNTNIGGHKSKFYNHSWVGQINWSIDLYFPITVIGEMQDYFLKKREMKG